MPGPVEVVDLSAIPPEGQQDAPAPVVSPPGMKPSEVLKPNQEVVHKLADGRTVVLKRYPRSLTLLVTQALGENSLNPMLTAYYRCVAWVRQVDGVFMPELRTAKDFNWVIEYLGDDALDEIADVVWSLQSANKVDRKELGNSSTIPSGEKSTS